MALIPPDGWSDVDQKGVHEQLDRILKSGPFLQSRRRQRFLEYIVTETLAGRGKRLKGYNIALEVFDRPETFDSNVDPTVRMEAGRLRDRLREYYNADGQSDPILIELPKGTYTPHIEFRQATALETGPERPDAATPVRRQAPSRRSAFRKFGWKQLGMLAAVLLLFITAGLSWMNGWDAGPLLPDKPSIAVLPFDNIGDDDKWERLADGISEDIITDLAHSKNLIVIARNSTSVYKDRPVDVRQIGRDLGVKYVLEGSIQAMGERIRVTAQLIEAASGSHVWSERYERPIDDLFAVQSDVTGKIAATLTSYQGPVAESERSLLRRKPPSNLTAYDSYLLAMEMKHKVTNESLTKAEGLFRQALELDPQLARAYVGLADVYFYKIDLGLAPSVEEALSKLTEAAEKAVELDPDDGKTHQALAMAYAYHGKPEHALAEYDRAESLAPSDADLLLINAWALPQFGESGRALSLAERALILNPRYPDWYNQGLGFAYFFGDQYDKSVKYRLLVKEPHVLDYAFLAMAYAYLGRTSEATAAAANVAKHDPAWVAEKYLSEAGGFADRESELFVNGARKAGILDCIPADKLKDIPDLIRVKSCDQQRAKISG